MLIAVEIRRQFLMRVSAGYKSSVNSCMRTRTRPALLHIWLAVNVRHHLGVAVGQRVGDPVVAVPDYQLAAEADDVGRAALGVVHVAAQLFRRQRLLRRPQVLNLNSLLVVWPGGIVGNVLDGMAEDGLGRLGPSPAAEHREGGLPAAAGSLLNVGLPPRQPLLDALFQRLRPGLRLVRAAGVSLRVHGRRHLNTPLPPDSVRRNPLLLSKDMWWSAMPFTAS